MTRHRLDQHAWGFESLLTLVTGDSAGFVKG
jgi:hypothetical protein